MRISVIHSVFILFVLLLCCETTMAQTPPPSDPPAEAPFDGLTTVLLLAGIGYAAKGFRKKTESDT